MYAESVILANLVEFERKNGWMPVYHTLDEVEEFKAYIDKITTPDANSRNTYYEVNRKITKKRADEIRRFVQNEQCLCSIDDSYWETRYAYIIDNAGNEYKFQNRQAQAIFDSILCQFDIDQVAIEIFILKARQLGISTKVALKFLRRLLFMTHTQAVMASINTDKSELLGRMIQVCLQRLPWWLIPRRTRASLRATEFDNGSILVVQSGSQATGIAEGWTPTLIHISEIGDIPNPKKVLEEGLFRATHPTRKLFAVYEGTGKGNTGWQADKWRACKEDWPRGKERLCPIFLSWPTAPDQYPEPDWLRKFPVPDGFRPHATTRKHVQRCELYIRSTDYIAKIMGKDWRMPLEQQWFWQFNYDMAVKTHTVKNWLSMMPADDIEALQGKNDSVFDVEVLNAMSEQRERGYQDYGIRGESIDNGLEPREEDIDYNKEFIRVSWKSNRGQVYTWTMVPLKPCTDDDDEKLVLGRVRVFREPEENRDYSIGIDTADGLGIDDEDRAALSVTDSVTGDQCDTQVCEFVANTVNAPQMVGFAACLGAWYGERTKDPRGVKFCIEQRMRSGDDCQLQLKFMGFIWHHINIAYDHKGAVKENRGNIEGFRTNETTRPMVFGRFIDAIHNGWYTPNSKWLIQECRDFVRKTLSTGKTRMDHESGKHDDRIMAAALSYFTRHAFDVMADRATKRYALPVGKMAEVDYAYPQTGMISVGN